MTSKELKKQGLFFLRKIKTFSKKKKTVTNTPLTNMSFDNDK
jgi:hypothetical protein